MTVREAILEFLREQGGEFKAPEGNAGRLIAEQTGSNYSNVSTTLYRMVQRGELDKHGGQRRAYAYRLREGPGSRGGLTEALDYDALAAALLRRVLRFGADPENAQLKDAVQRAEERAAETAREAATLRRAVEEHDAEIERLKRQLSA